MPWEPIGRPLHSGWPDVNPSTQSSSPSIPSAAPSQIHRQDHSQSNTLSPDHSAPPQMHPHVRDLATTPSRPRSSSLAVMGQNISRSPSPSNLPASTSSQLHKGIAVATATGHRLKRAFGGRRMNKSEDASILFNAAREADREYYTDSDVGRPSTSSTEVMQHAPGASKRAKMSLQLAHQVFSGGRKSSDRQSPSTPPPPPPKPVTAPPAPLQVAGHHNIHSRGSIIAVSPGISSALNFMRLDDMDRERDEKLRTDVQRRDQDKITNPDKGEPMDREAWRKSDSTMSHHTIRPGSETATRSSRPVSMAESLQSNHTIVPVNKRLSAMLTDADYVTVEEESSSTYPPQPVPVPASSPTSSQRSRKRRSMSLNIGVSSVAKVYAAPSSAPATTTPDPKLPSKSFDDVHPRIAPSVSREIPTLTPTAANGFISPSSTGPQSTGTNIRGKLAAWTATNHSNASLSQSSLPSHPLGPARYSPTPPPNPRQPTISMTGGFGLAKRAVEKMNRAWGGLSSGSSSHSGLSSSSSSTAPSSYSDHNLTRVGSNQSGIMGRSSKKSRRTPDAPSGTWSINSATSSISDSDVFAPPAGPYLGKKLRGPMRLSGGGGGGGAAGGVVFGRDLKAVTRETAVGVGVDICATDLESVLGPERAGSMDKDHFHVLEKRMLPALVVRCAQHILIWGVQEEGLFRVSGRPSHVSKLRSEFNTGADFDMTQCSPGELDPHAVASVFKAFLRELPEPILTTKLLPYFEAVISQENAVNSQQASAKVDARRTGGARASGLPSGPKGGFQGLHKPPSLSTLAMPTLSGMRPPSRALINALKSLLSQLPPENKDLIRTVAELIKATDADSKTTKMTLSNLLLVFCPSLNMNPPLLKILCELNDIWDASPIDGPVLDIKRESLVLDITLPSSAQTTEGAVEDDEMETSRPSIDDSVHSFSSNSSADEAGRVPRSRPMGPRRHVPAIIYGDVGDENNNGIRSSSPGSLAGASSDDVSSYGTSEGHSMTSASNPYVSSSPPLSSSAESLPTPDTSSANQSLTHIPFVNDPCTKSEPVLSPPFIASPAFNERKISDPVHVSSMDSNEPMHTIAPRRSIPLLSLPGRSSPPSPANSLPGTMRHKMKKPSLSLLFSKRSASPLRPSPNGRPYISSPYLQMHSASESSLSTPISAVTAPTGSPDFPPVLDTQIESSPLRFDLGIEHSPLSEGIDSPKKYPFPTSPDALDDTYIEAGPTPIADRYRSESTATLPETPPFDNVRPPHLRPHPTRNFTSTSSTSTTSSNHLGILDDDEVKEDWTQSVLMAAGAEWSSSKQ